MGSEYRAPWLASFLHSFPHLDLTFKEVNSTFNPQDARYRESLVFWAALPVLWLLVTLLIFLVYFCYRCCQRDVEKKQDVPCLRWSMAILALLTCGAIGVGFYGNEETHKGALQFVTAAEDADDTVGGMRTEVYRLQRNINETVEIGIRGLKNVYTAHHALLQRQQQMDLHELTDESYGFAKDILDDVANINRKAHKVNMSLVSYIKEYGFYRWLGTILLLGWMVLICLVLLFGVGRSSKCTLLLFCAFGIFILVLCWMSAGLHMGVSVGFGDFCVAPDAYIQRLASEQIERDIVNYYIKCDSRLAANPFKDALQSASNNLRLANATLIDAKAMAVQYIPLDEVEPHVRQVMVGLSASQGTIMKLMALVDCRNLHKDYADGVEAICFAALPGLVFLLLSAVVTGLFFTILVLLASKAWKHFSRSAQYLDEQDDGTEKYAGEYVYNAEERVPLQNVEDASHYRKGYLEVDDEDPFLPRPDNASPSYIRYDSLPSRPTSSPRDSGASYTRGRHGNRPEHMQMQQRGSTPPPAYNSNSNAFYPRQDPYLNHSIPDDHSDLGGRESIA